MELLPEAEVIGLLTLMLLQKSRRTTRTSATGDIMLNRAVAVAMRDGYLVGLQAIDRADDLDLFGN
nr:DUF6596 domain-containing protein [Chamaesiphon polymorphus]